MPFKKGRAHPDVGSDKSPNCSERLNAADARKKHARLNGSVHNRLAQLSQAARADKLSVCPLADI
jgi:hypothetical protein